MVQGFMWECSCGHVEYNEEEPDECSRCGSMGNFIKMPGEIIEEREKEIEELYNSNSRKIKLIDARRKNENKEKKKVIKV